MFNNKKESRNMTIQLINYKTKKDLKSISQRLSDYANENLI